MKIFVYENYEKMSRAAAQFLAAQLMEKPCSHIGLTAGKTPMGLFQELIRLYEEGQHVFSEAWYYNLEEIIGYGPDSPESYCVILRNLLLDHIGVAPERMRMPNGLAKDPAAECLRFDEYLDSLPAGGLDIQVLGLGQDGHIGCNRPGDTLTAHSHVVSLSRGRTGTALGMSSIMKANCLLMLANGEDKAQAVADMCNGAISTHCPSTFLQLHPNTLVLLDQAAASRL